MSTFHLKKLSNWTTWLFLFFFSFIWHTGYKITYQIFYAFWDNILAMSNPNILVQVILTGFGKCKYYFPASAQDCVVRASFSPPAVFPVFILLITEYETAYTSCSISVQIVSFLFHFFLSLSPYLCPKSVLALRKYFFFLMTECFS